jgi:hypothetical protein
MKPLREHYIQSTDQGDVLNVFDYIEALEKYVEELNVDKLLDDFHEWIELNEWDFYPVSFNGTIKYRWSTETYSQATTKELFEMFLSQK